MRNKLFDKRKEKKYTQRQIAELIGINQSSYCLIERGLRNPSHEVLKKIFAILGEESISLINDTELSITKCINSDVSKNILMYMNSLGHKKYDINDIKNIRKSLIEDWTNRKQQNIKIASRSKEGKQQIYNQVATLCNEKFNTNFNGQDICLFKKCTRLEFEDRTKKSTWSIPKMRNNLGFDVTTGIEIE